MVESMERLDNIETLARITLLSVPEWCGSAYSDLERRVAALEIGLAVPKRALIRESVARNLEGRATARNGKENECD